MGWFLVRDRVGIRWRCDSVGLVEEEEEEEEEMVEKKDEEECDLHRG